MAILTQKTDHIEAITNGLLYWPLRSGTGQITTWCLWPIHVMNERLLYHLTQINTYYVDVYSEGLFAFFLNNRPIIIKVIKEIYNTSYFSTYNDNNAGINSILNIKTGNE